MGKRRPRGKCKFHNRRHKKYRTPEAAGRARDRLQAENPKFVYNVFRCPACPFYHVGRDWVTIEILKTMKKLRPKRRIGFRNQLDKFLRMRVEMYG